MINTGDNVMCLFSSTGEHLERELTICHLVESVSEELVVCDLCLVLLLNNTASLTLIVLVTKKSCKLSVSSMCITFQTSLEKRIFG